MFVNEGNRFKTIISTPEKAQTAVQERNTVFFRK